jgi:hypothetical protein
VIASLRRLRPRFHSEAASPEVDSWNFITSASTVPKRAKSRCVACMGNPPPIWQSMLRLRGGGLISLSSAPSPPGPPRSSPCEGGQHDVGRSRIWEAISDSV